MLNTFILKKYDGAKNPLYKDFHLGIILVKRQQYMEARDRFKTVVEEAPRMLPDILTCLYRQLIVSHEDLHLRLLITELYIFRGSYREALHELEDLFDINPEFTQTYFLLAKLYKRAGFKKTIQSIFERAFEQNITDAAIIDLLPKMYIEDGDMGKSIAFFEKLIRLHPTAVHYHRSLAQLFLEKRDIERAVEIYQQVAEQFPDKIADSAERCHEVAEEFGESFPVCRTLATLYIRSCQPEKAVRQLARCCELNPEFTAEARKELKQMLGHFPDNPDVMLASAELLIREQEYSQAVTYLKKIMMHAPDYQDAALKLVHAILEAYPKQVLALMLAIDMCCLHLEFAKAFPYLRTLAEFDEPDVAYLEEKLWLVIQRCPALDHQARLLLAGVYLKSGALDKCQSICLLLLETDVDFEARVLIAECEKWSGKPELCKQRLFDCFLKHRYKWEIHDALLSFHDYSLHQFESAIPAPQRAKEYFDKGLLRLQRYDLQGALEHFQKASSDYGMAIESKVLIGRCFLEIGRYDLAGHQFKRILERYDQLEMSLANALRFLLAMSLANSGELENAVHSLERIMAHDINFPHLKGLLPLYKDLSANRVRGKLLGACMTSQGAPVVFCVPNMEEPVGHSHPATEENMSFGHPHNNQGVAYFLTQNYKSAEEEFRLAIQMDSRFTSALCNLALLKLIRQETEDVGALLDHAQKINPRLDQVPFIRGLLDMQKRNTSAAIAHFHEAVYLNPLHHAAYLNLGDCYYSQQQVEKAFSNWEKAAGWVAFFPLIQRRIHYLKPFALTFHHWLYDFNYSFNDIFKPGRHVSSSPADGGETVEMMLSGFEDLLS